MMPRTRLPGGTRAGTPGQAYSNRTDLNQNRSLPVRVATGQTYGKAQAQAEAQRAIPMAPPPQPATMPLPGGGGQAAPSSPGLIPPGAFGDIHRPTERPAEPVTAGAALGPGPGPEAIPRGPTNPVNINLSSMLAELAQQSGSNAIQQLAQRAQAAGA
jgi:hypothetical protein